MVGELLPWDTIASIIFLINIVFVVLVVFYERRNPSATLAWVMALTLLPVAGFVLYIFLGQNFRRERMFRIKREDDQRLHAIVRSQQDELKGEGTTLQIAERVPANLRCMV